jgi:hypothetical protein
MVIGNLAAPLHYPEKSRLCNGGRFRAGHRRVSGMNRVSTPFDENFRKTNPHAQKAGGEEP